MDEILKEVSRQLGYTTGICRTFEGEELKEIGITPSENVDNVGNFVITNVEDKSITLESVDNK